jgi:wobble nucleotide-excising tRNase
MSAPDNPLEIPLKVEAIPSKPKNKRVMNEAMLENLKKAREKALASRQEMKLLKEREDILKQEEIDARWEKLHEEEERIKSMKKPPARRGLQPLCRLTQPPAATCVQTKTIVKPKPTKKGKIIHVSPPLSEESSIVSSSSEEDIPVTKNKELVQTSRRANRANKNIIGKPAVAEPQAHSQGCLQPQAQAQAQTQADVEHIQQLHRAMRALGLTVR